MKVIFLDIDGVLNITAGPEPTWKKQTYHIEEELVEMLNMFLVDNLDIMIVVSSSWRDDMDDLKRQLEHQGFEYWNNIIGHTMLEGDFRGLQVATYMEENSISNYVILDDMYYTHEDIDPKRFIKTNPYTGITDEDIKLIGEILNEV